MLIFVCHKRKDTALIFGWTSYEEACNSLTSGWLICRETVLVTAAAGATGLAAVDIAANVFNCTVSRDVIA